MASKTVIRPINNNKDNYNIIQGVKLLNADCCNRGYFLLITLSPRANYSLLIGRAAKILAPDWLSTPVLHFLPKNDE